MKKFIFLFINLISPFLIYSQVNIEFDTYHPNNNAYQTVTYTGALLESGVSYTVRVQGTFSPWGSNAWTNPCGSPDNAPLYSSSTGETGLVGHDFAFNFGLPNTSSCNPTPNFPKEISTFNVSLDGGNDWYLPIFNEMYNSEHIYTFEIIGQGQFFMLKNLDLNSSDNYGKFLLEINQNVTSAHSSIDVTCNGGADGGIIITVSGGIPPYAYSIDNGLTFQSNNNTFYGLAAGTYSIVVEDSQGAQTINSATITEPEAFGFHTTATPPTCYGGLDGQINVDSVFGENSNSLTYSIDEGNYFQTDSIFSFLAAGTYTVIAMDAYGCIADTSVILTTEPLDGTITQINGSLVSNQDDVEYQWILCEGETYSNIDGATNQSFTPLVNGDYALLITNESGCTLLTECINFSSVAIEEEISNNGIEVFPNPTSDNLHIYFKKEFQDVQIIVRDVTGRIFSVENQSNPRNVSISIDSASEGIYFIEITENQRTWIYKLIKK